MIIINYKQGQLRLTNMKRYLIWKASITEFRVLDRSNGKSIVMENLMAFNCTFHVDLEAYNRAQKSNFVNSGRENDYFAWIEADMVFINSLGYTFKDKVWYNPFLHSQFRDRATKEVVNMAQSICTIGNTLTYQK